MSKTRPWPARTSRLLGMMALGLAMAAAPARSDVVMFSPNGSSAPIAITALNFAAGNVVVQNGDNLTKGSTVQLYFQATLGSVNLASGSQYTPTGLNSTAAGGYQITLVASLTETVTNVFSSPTTATFALASVQASNSFVELYYNPSVVANPYAGTGFNVGTNIMTVTPNASMPSSGNFTFAESSPGVPVVQAFDQSGTGRFPGVQSIVGSGSASIGGSVNTENSSFFLSSVKALTLNAIDSTPFQGVDPSKLFANMPGGVPPGFSPNIGLVNGSTTGGGTDFQFQSQSNISFFVPEPSAFALMGVGLAGLIGSVARSQYRSRAESTSKDASPVG